MPPHKNSGCRTCCEAIGMAYEISEVMPAVNAEVVAPHRDESENVHCLNQAKEADTDDLLFKTGEISPWYLCLAFSMQVRISLEKFLIVALAVSQVFSN